MWWQKNLKIIKNYKKSIVYEEIRRKFRKNPRNNLWIFIIPSSKILKFRKVRRKKNCLKNPSFQNVILPPLMCSSSIYKRSTFIVRTMHILLYISIVHQASISFSFIRVPLYIRQHTNWKIILIVTSSGSR